MSSFHPRPKDGLPTHSCFRAVDQATASHKCWRHMTKLRYLEQESYSLWKHRKIQFTHYFLGTTTTTTVENLPKNVWLLTWQEIKCCSYLEEKRRSFCPQEKTTCSPLITPTGWFSKRERHLTTGKRAERTKLDFRCPICCTAIGQPSCLICARRRQLTFPFFC